MLVCYIAVTALLAKIYATYFPYHVLSMNKLHINVMVIRIWIAVILIIANLLSYTNQDDLFGLSLLFLISPTLLLITNHQVNLRWNTQVMARKSFSHLWELEHIIRAEVLKMKNKD